VICQDKIQNKFECSEVNIRFRN